MSNKPGPFPTMLFNAADKAVQLLDSPSNHEHPAETAGSGRLYEPRLQAALGKALAVTR